MIAIVAFSYAACGSGDDTTAAAQTTTAATTTTEKLTETQPSGVAIGDVAAADSPVDRFASHPALLLWEDSAAIPGATDGMTAPTVVPYLSEGDAGVMVLLQGTSSDGGYYISEGAPVAEYLNSLGYDVFICKYRLTDSYTDAVVDDVRRTVRYVRSHAEDFGVAGKKTALVGFGTGALLAHIESCDVALGAPAADAIDALDAKPDITLLFNPDMAPADGMFASAAPVSAPERNYRVGVYYDSKLPRAGDVLRFCFDLMNQHKLLYAEVHGIDSTETYKDGGDRAESYATLYEMMNNYLKLYKFN